MAAKISMFIKRNKPFFIALAIAIGTALTYAVFNAVLAHFDLQLTRYVLYAVYIICVLCILFMFLYCIVVCIKKVRQNKWNILGAFVAVCLMGAFLFLQIYVFFLYEPIHVVERNEEKFIAYSRGMLFAYDVDCYDYHGWLVCGKEIRIHIHYDTGRDPLSMTNEEREAALLRWADFYNKDGSIDDYERIVDCNADGSEVVCYKYWHHNKDGSIESYKLDHFSDDLVVITNSKTS